MPSKINPSPLFNERHVLLARKYTYWLALIAFISENWGHTRTSIRLFVDLIIVSNNSAEFLRTQTLHWEDIDTMGHTASLFVFFFGAAFVIRWLLNEFSNSICETERQVRRKTRERRRRLKFLVSEEQLMARINTLEACLDTSINKAHSLEEQIAKLGFNIEALENRKRPKQQIRLAPSNEPVDLFTTKPTKPTLVKPPKRRTQKFPKFELPKF